MIKSMTGYGREETNVNSYDIVVEIRSVNHRYFEFSSKLPRSYNYLDDKLKSFINTKVSRGKVETYVSITKEDGANAEIEVNLEIAKGYVNALRNAQGELNVTDDLALSNLIRLPDVFSIKKVEDDEEVIISSVLDVASTALDKFILMREIEGEKMRNDISSRLDYLEKRAKEIDGLSPKINENYKNKLYQKIKDTLSDSSVDIDESRILTEVAIFADKTAVDEETVRLHSHISQFRDLINESIPVGRKLDFLVQELNREVNTIGSKAGDLSITKMVVEMKGEIEKIREQIQNIE